MNKYKRLNMVDREEISRGLSAGWTFSHIALNIHRPVSTVSDEVWKNCKYKRTYRAGIAQKKSDLVKVRQKQSKKLDQDGPLKEHVLKYLSLEWSPDEIARRLKKTLTYDRGSEMAEHKLFLKETKIQVYFCDPHSPWQRGTNENTNGLIRQYFPKGTDFRTVTKKEILRVQDRLNGRPRRVLAYAKPDEMFIPLLTTKILC